MEPETIKILGTGRSKVRVSSGQLTQEASGSDLILLAFVGFCSLFTLLEQQLITLVSVGVFLNVPGPGPGGLMPHLGLYYGVF